VDQSWSVRHKEKFAGSCLRALMLLQKTGAVKEASRFSWSDSCTCGQHVHIGCPSLLHMTFHP
jgi:hypothetical protein